MEMQRREGPICKEVDSGISLFFSDSVTKPISPGRGSRVCAGGGWRVCDRVAG